jgi:perosamine synthetase
MTVRVPLSAVCLSEIERRYVIEALDQEMVSSAGPHVRKFESLLAEKVGVRHAVATASGTSALELLLRALGIGNGDEVIVPAFTFAGPALAVALVGAVPVFADVTTETWTLDPDHARALRTPRTRAIIAVDVLGHACDYDALASLDLPIIEDGAEAHGATYKGHPVGSFGVAAIFSFHANKAISCGEGGCIVTDDGALAERLRQLNAFGMDPQRRYWHTKIGCNHRMANLVAAVGLGQMERWDALLAGRTRVAAAYDEALSGLPVDRRPVAPWAREAVWLYTIASDQRDSILESCRRNAIDARAVWPALPTHPAFRQFGPVKCRRAEEIANRSLWLPTWSNMPGESIKAVAAAVAEGLMEGAS